MSLKNKVLIHVKEYFSIFISTRKGYENFECNSVSSKQILVSKISFEIYLFRYIN